METERKRSHWRERRKAEHSSLAKQPVDPMPSDETSNTNTPPPTNTIARSMSRYKGARPKPRSLNAEGDQCDTPAPVSRKTSDFRSPKSARSRPEAEQGLTQEYGKQASSYGTKRTIPIYKSQVHPALEKILFNSITQIALLTAHVIRGQIEKMPCAMTTSFGMTLAETLFQFGWAFFRRKVLAKE